MNNGTANSTGNHGLQEIMVIYLMAQLQEWYCLLGCGPAMGHTALDITGDGLQVS